MTDFTEEQDAVLATLTLVYPAGVSLTEDRVDDIELCDSLVASGHVVRIDSDDFNGVAFQLSEEFAVAHQAEIERRAAEAEQN